MSDKTPDGKDRDPDAIEANLKRVYEDVLQEAVPDRFASLLQQLKSQDQNSSGGDSA